MRNEPYCFGRQEAPPVTPAESCFRNFKVSCLKCRSFAIRPSVLQDAETGEEALVFVCGKCGNVERLKL